MPSSDNKAAYLKLCIGPSWTSSRQVQQTVGIVCMDRFNHEPNVLNPLKRFTNKRLFGTQKEVGSLELKLKIREKNVKGFF